MFERPNRGPASGPADDGEIAAADAIGTDERRMHVRAYNHWVSLLGGRAFPSIGDIDPATTGDFAAHSVLLDFRAGVEHPLVPYLGDLLRHECGVTGPILSVAEVPSRSLLSRLTDHYLQIIANRSPIGFEAEFVGTRGTTMLYRGILMPFSSDGEAIDYVYGVINWKEVLDQAGTAELRLELEQALTRDAAEPCARWADGPSNLVTPPVDVPAAEPDASEGLSDRLAAARDEADRARSADGRSREALYAAIGRAHDFALAAEADADGYAELLQDAGLKPSPRAPMTPVAKLVFGIDHDKTRLAEIAAALAHARANEVGDGAVAAWIAGHAGGLKGVVAAARAARRGTANARPSRTDRVRARLRETTPSRVMALAGDEEFVLIVARRVDEGHVGLLGPITDPAAVDRALASLAA